MDHFDEEVLLLTLTILVTRSFWCRTKQRAFRYACCDLRNFRIRRRRDVGWVENSQQEKRLHAKGNIVITKIKVCWLSSCQRPQTDRKADLQHIDSTRLHYEVWHVLGNCCSSFFVSTTCNQVCSGARQLSSACSYSVLSCSAPVQV